MQENSILSKDEDLKSELNGITLGSTMYLLNDLIQTVIFFIPVLWYPCILPGCNEK